MGCLIFLFELAYVPETAFPASGMVVAEVLAEADQQYVMLVEQLHISMQVNWARVIQKIYEADP